MDFDEYEYLENTVENPEAKKLEGKANGGDKVVEYEEKDRSRSSKRRSVDNGDDLDRPSKQSRSRNESYDHEKERGSRHGSSARDREKGERDRHSGSREHRVRDKDESNGKERNRDRERDSDKKRSSNRERRERDYERDGIKEEDHERSERSRNRPDRHQDERGGERSKDMEGVDTDFKERRVERPFRNHDREHRGQTVVSSILKFFSVHISLNCHFVPQDFDLGFGSFKHTGDICASLLELLSFMNMETSHIIYLFSRSKAFSQGSNMQMVKADAHVLVNKTIKRYKEKKEDKVEPEVDPERDQRTVFAYQITLKAGERDIYEFFSKAGKVRDVRLIMDRNTRRSKGVGYIEFYDVMSVPMAIALSGQPLLGQPVMVKPSEAEKNLVQSTATSGGLLGPYSGGARRLYVGNLPLTIKEDQIRQVFEPFGTVELIQMPSEPGTGNCKGYAFIQFARLEDAKAAQNLNGQLEIAGRVIKVSAITDQAGMLDAGANLADLDDDEGSGLSLNAQSRALLMQKLDRTGTAASFTGLTAASALGQNSGQVLPGLTAAGFSMPAAVTGSSMDSVGTPSECLLLKNMFDPSSETEPDFDLDIKEDVQDECSKYGRLKHIHVEKNSAGFVYLRFENTQSAIGAQKALHGRWFAGKMITATYMVHSEYDAKFPGSS